MTRVNRRDADELRSIFIESNYIKNADGSVKISFGDTCVICTAKIKLNNVPQFRKNTGEGWLTAEYGMLPCSTNDRIQRYSLSNINARALEIQRLIGRSLRASLNFKKLGEHTIMIDCDVIQADGGTRTASITGAFIAMENAISKFLEKGIIRSNPLLFQIAAVSIGIKDDQILLDLDYEEDSSADMDCNIVMNSDNKFIEIQSTSESARCFTDKDMISMMHLSSLGIKKLFEKQAPFLINFKG